MILFDILTFIYSVQNSISHEIITSLPLIIEVPISMTTKASTDYFAEELYEEKISCLNFYYLFI